MLGVPELGYRAWNKTDEQLHVKDKDRKVANNLWTALFMSRTRIEYLKHKHTFLTRRQGEAEDAALSIFSAEEVGSLIHGW